MAGYASGGASAKAKGAARAAGAASPAGTAGETAELERTRKELEAAYEEIARLRARVATLEARSVPTSLAPASAAAPREPTDEDARRLLDHLHRETFVRLGASPIAGVGVFALRDIPAGIDPFPIVNPHMAPCERFVIFSSSQLRKVPEPVKEQILSFFAPITKDDGWAPDLDKKGDIQYGVLTSGLNALNTSWYLNHSDEPNIVFKDATEDCSFNSYVTRCRIEAGTELTVDYRELGKLYYELVTGTDGGRDPRGL
eukprot:TRINITY_DN29779_c0_g1_i1.p1 TRINITY_DN29779_c0_g1~~TRINITY_DN29779_c0_g1_i1.p1  ORF type:complete len:280 (+),score=49.62 TRINITY_DN29779_c0_g1_i1:72-842(+)